MMKTMMTVKSMMINFEDEDHDDDDDDSGVPDIQSHHIFVQSSRKY